MKRSRGFRSKTRNKLKGGRFSLAESLKTFKIGESVRVKINPAVHNGMPFSRYQNSQGVVTEQRGRAYIVDIKDGNKKKTLISRPEHLTTA